MDTKNLAVIGFGGRGHIYGEFARKYPEKFQLKAVAETDEYRRRDARKISARRCTRIIKSF